MNIDTPDCQVCGVGSLKENFKTHTMMHNGYEYQANLYFSRCNSCYSKITNEEQSLQNIFEVNRYKQLLEN